MTKLAIVIPCYNEEAVIEQSVTELTRVMQELIDTDRVSNDSILLFVDDGSRDRTWELIEQFHSKNHFVTGLKLAGNVGHQNALLAGLMFVKNRTDAAISIDADLQDDVEVIKEMIDKISNSHSYDEALNIIGEYVEITDEIGLKEEETEFE